MNRIRSISLLFVCATLLLVAPRAAEARKVFLNGVNLAGVDLPAVTLKGCDVHIDAKGNIHITARNYKIQVDGSTGGTARPTPARPATNPTNLKTVGSASEKYFLVSFFNKKGATQYDIEVFVNGTMVRRIRARSSQVAMDITRHIKRGKRNEIIFVSRKNLGTRGRISASAMDYFRVVLGSGFESKGQIVLKRSLMETRRTASQTRSTYTEKHVAIFR